MSLIREWLTISRTLKFGMSNTIVRDKFKHASMHRKIPSKDIYLSDFSLHRLLALKMNNDYYSTLHTGFRKHEVSVTWEAKDKRWRPNRLRRTKIKKIVA